MPGTRTRAIVCWSITVLPNSQPTSPLTTATATTASTQRSTDARQYAAASVSPSATVAKAGERVNRILVIVACAFLRSRLGSVAQG